MKELINTENWLMTQAYLEPYQISMMELFVKSLWLFLPKNTILDVWKGFWNSSKSNIVKRKNLYFNVYEIVGFTLLEYRLVFLALIWKTH